MSNTTATSALITVDEAAVILGVCRAHVYNLDVSGRLGPMPVHLGRSIRWNRKELLDWVEAGCPPRVKWLAGRRAR